MSSSRIVPVVAAVGVKVAVPVVADVSLMPKISSNSGRASPATWIMILAWLSPAAKVTTPESGWPAAKSNASASPGVSSQRTVEARPSSPARITVNSNGVEPDRPSGRSWGPEKAKVTGASSLMMTPKLEPPGSKVFAPCVALTSLNRNCSSCSKTLSPRTEIGIVRLSWPMPNTASPESAWPGARSVGSSMTITQRTVEGPSRSPARPIWTSKDVTPVSPSRCRPGPETENVTSAAGTIGGVTGGSTGGGVTGGTTGGITGGSVGGGVIGGVTGGVTGGTTGGTTGGVTGGSVGGGVTGGSDGPISLPPRICHIQTPAWPVFPALVSTRAIWVALPEAASS